VAIDSEDRSFESKLKLIKDKKDYNIKNIISRFVAKKLAQNFREINFNINGNKYSKFSTKLYNDVENSIILTNSFNPYDWAKKLIRHNDFDEITEILNTINSSENKDEEWKKYEHKLNRFIPEHINSWNNLNSKITRKRLIVWHQTELDNLLSQEPFFLFFKNINNIDIEPNNNAFTTHEDLKSMNINIDVEKYDYVIFDNKLALEWKIIKDNNQVDIPSEIKLIDLELTERDDLTEFKNFIRFNPS
jgi:hypothetical protein